MSVSFAVITDMRRPEKLAACVQSIQALKIPRFEINVSIDYKGEGKLGALRNRACKKAIYGTMVVCDDDILFRDDFYQGLERYGDDWDVLSCILLNPDGTRHWDWMTYGGPTGHHLLGYDEPDDGNVYPPGGLCILKYATFLKVRWSEEIGFQQGAAEDVDYGIRLHKAGYQVKFNPYCTAVHDDPRYTQSGKVVIRHG
jgi:hypothetical protein